MRKSGVADGSSGGGGEAEAVGSANQPRADTFKCQSGAAGTHISNNTLAAHVQFPSSRKGPIVSEATLIKETWADLTLLLTKDLYFHNTRFKHQEIYDVITIL